MRNRKLEEFLESSEVIDWQDLSVQAKASELMKGRLKQRANRASLL
jgi:hypothetical protein